MSTYRESYAKGASQAGFSRFVSEEFEQEFPMVSNVFAGEYDADGKTCIVPSASIVLFAEAGKLKFCITPRVGNRVAFGTCDDPVKGLASVEQALARGNYEWKSKGK
jgi:hypothetical protein